MFDYEQKSSGSSYTTIVALLACAFIFSPAVLMASSPIGYVSLSVALSCSLVCIALAWVHWKKHSQSARRSLIQPSRSN